MSDGEGYVDVLGADALHAFAKELKASDKELAKAFRRDVRKILKPAMAEAKNQAKSFPARGTAWRSTPAGTLRNALARSVDSETRFTASATRITVRSSASKLGRALGGGGGGALNMMAAGRIPWRHPRPKGGGPGRGADVKHWYTQTGHDWLGDAVVPMTPQVVEEIQGLVNQYSEQLATSVKSREV